MIENTTRIQDYWAAVFGAAKAGSQFDLINCNEIAMVFKETFCDVHRDVVGLREMRKEIIDPSMTCAELLKTAAKVLAHE